MNGCPNCEVRNSRTPVVAVSAPYALLYAAFS